MKNGRIIALGFFDSLHIGHQKIIKECINLSNEYTPSVFMFDGDLKAYFNKNSDGTVFTLSERKSLIRKLGIKDFIIKKVEKSFFSLKKEEFLDLLVKEYNAKGFVCGFDFTFGFKGEGDTDFLRDFCKKNNLLLKVIKEVKKENKKVSTTLIKELLKSGEIVKANEYLGRNYFISGLVKEGRKVGKTLGFPTVNITVSKKRTPLKHGVYKGKVYINKKEYKVLINYGKAPTFSVEKVIVEGYIEGFSGNLYGKKITLFFEDFLRDIKKFSSKEELIKQLKEDINKIK